MPDQIEELFARLRTETIGQVRPPGAAAARRTVRRRRAAATAAVATAVGVVAGAVLLSGGRAPEQTAPVAGPSTEDPVARAEQSLANVADAPGEIHSGVVTSPTYVSLTAIEAGNYLLYLGCVGPGSIGIEIRSGRQSRPSENVSCGENPDAARLPVAVTGRTSLLLVLNGTDNPAYALKLVRSS